MVTQNSWNSSIPVEVPLGGTGVVTTTPYSVLCGGTTSTAPLQNVSGVGASGQVLTSNGAAALPTWQTGSSSIANVNQIVFTSSGTYTPTSGMTHCVVEAVGGGGGGGGINTGGSGVSASGGGSGGYVRVRLTAADIGASKSVTIGAAGTAGSAAGGNGGNGGATSLGTFFSAGGGIGGIGNGSFGTSGGLGGTATSTISHSVISNGAAGGPLIAISASFQIGGFGANSVLGAGGTVSSTGSQTNAVSYGGGGAANFNNSAGGTGYAGVVIITEYIL